MKERHPDAADATLSRSYLRHEKKNSYLEINGRFSSGFKRSVKHDA